MPHYTEQQIEAANNVSLVAFLKATPHNSG